MDIFASAEFQQAIANIILLVVTGITGAIAKAVYTFIRTKTSGEQFALLEALASSAVYASEQQAIAGLINDKKQVAMEIVNVGLKNAGITNLTADQIASAIEAAVKENLNYSNGDGTVTVETQNPDVTVTVEPDATDEPQG